MNKKTHLAVYLELRGVGTRAQVYPETRERDTQIPRPRGASAKLSLKLAGPGEVGPVG